jgi:hypothetical protein
MTPKPVANQCGGRMSLADRHFDGGVSCASIVLLKTSSAFEITRKRRRSFPSETHVKRGRRFVHGDVELIEKLGRNDLCPCGSGRRFQELLHEIAPLRRRQSQPVLLGIDEMAGTSGHFANAGITACAMASSRRACLGDRGSSVDRFLIFLSHLRRSPPLGVFRE